jgi:hypothetical protein
MLQDFHANATEGCSFCYLLFGDHHSMSLGTNFAEIRYIPKSSVKIV